MLLNTLQGTGQPPQSQRIIWPQISIVLRLTNPALGTYPLEEVGLRGFFLTFIHLAGLGLSCGTRSLIFTVAVAACGIFSCSMQTLSCSKWDLVPWPGIEHRPPTLEAWSLSHWTTREVPRRRFFFFYFLSSRPLSTLLYKIARKEHESLTVTMSDKRSQPVRMEVWAFHPLRWLSVTGLQEGRPALGKIIQSRDSFERKLSISSQKVWASQRGHGDAINIQLTQPFCFG